MKEDLALAAAAANVSAQTAAPLDVSAQFLTFESGMYAVDFHAPRSQNLGLSLPCARLDPVSLGPALQGRAFVSMMSDGGWLSHGDLPAFIRVVGGQASVLLTIYRNNASMAAPELRIRYIRDDLDFQPGPADAAAAPAPAEGAPAERESAGAAPAALPDGTLRLPVLVHVQARGDIRADPGEWAGTPGSHLLLEGFAIAADPQAGIDPAELEYQGILGESWSTPWFPAGEFCGSRGMALPLLGFRVRLTGGAAELYDCVYAGSFIGRGENGPLGDGQACEAAGQPLDALRILIRRKAPPEVPKMPPTGTPAPPIEAPQIEAPPIEASGRTRRTSR